jgi:hypothetical protein
MRSSIHLRTEYMYNVQEAKRPIVSNSSPYKLG